MAPTEQRRQRPYHHGNLRRALLDAAIEVIGETGPAAMSMREVARRARVSSAAPTHHFGDKAGLLTALAAEGFDLLAAAMTDEYARSRSFREVGVAYVRFAMTSTAHFDVMFRPELYRTDDDAVLAARQAAASVLYAPAAERSGSDPGSTTAGIAAWSLVHGLATLLLAGNLPGELMHDPEMLARDVTSFLFAPSRADDDPTIP